MDTCALDQLQRAQIEQRLWDRQDAGIRELLGVLSYNPRRVLELRYGIANGHRYSIEEAAEVLAKPVSWVITIESCGLFQLYQFIYDLGIDRTPL